MGFKFEDRNVIVINIEDKDYKVHYNQELLSNILAISMKAQKASGNIKDDDMESINNACSIVKEGIDAVLGEKSSEEIFEGRKQDLMESIDVLMYIFDEINKFKNKKISDIKSRVPQNRQQRRHGKKNN